MYAVRKLICLADRNHIQYKNNFFTVAQILVVTRDVVECVISAVGVIDDNNVGRWCRLTEVRQFTNFRNVGASRFDGNDVIGRRSHLERQR
jgi:ApbE superfamily uncharacterized protein (UPF0280 family)